LESTASNENWFEYTFIRLFPVKYYFAHIEGYISSQNVTSYANVSFDIKRAIFYKSKSISISVTMDFKNTGYTGYGKLLIIPISYIKVHVICMYKAKYLSDSVSFDNLPGGAKKYCMYSSLYQYNLKSKRALTFKQRHCIQ
jgi:hypothetical protein